ncbi:serine/threonine protein kinase [Endozoicomonas sp. OPT23]|uniref:serine/threonine protein kinase n=1 Tax=Endozoicomonas sp. OPT23 TaxID=2072845 RepID=UPI00129AB45C|nr:serine/threonine protein kinase [Endozoicomonas sp. OPT23]MRI31709.1 serine/threonine protein kinase [Endozoicomonas sp. OPT23]
MSTTNQHPYESLTPDRVLDAVESQGFLSDARIMALNSYENRVYQVGIEDDLPVIAKFYRPGRWSREQIQEEHTFSHELKDMEFPVVAPIMNDNGETLFEFEGFQFALFKRMGGYPPELDNLDHLLILGRHMGRLHSLGAAKPFEHRPEITLQRYGVENVEWLQANNFIPDSLKTAYQTLARDILDKLARIESRFSPDIIRVHGDAHVGNILWRDDNPHFVDFDDTCMAPAIQDLWMFLSGDRQNQTLQITELLEGYEEFHEFNPVELNLVEYFRTLRLINYSGWLAKRWNDPAFPMAFTWFNTERYWAEHILELREQFAALDEPPLALSGNF